MVSGKVSGKAIRLARVHAGLLVRELADMAGVSHPLISYIELGKVPLSPKASIKIIKAFESIGYTVEDLERFGDVKR